MQNEIREQPTFAIASVVVVVATMLLVTVEISMTATENVFAYEKNQANAQANACGNGQVPTNTGCENIGSQIQGDGNAVAMAALHTFADVAQEPPGGPPTGGPPPQTCVECFTKFLTFREIVHFEDAWDPPLNEIGFLCTDLENTRGKEQVDFVRTIESVLLFRANVDQPTVDEVINCLKRILGLTP